MMLEGYAICAESEGRPQVGKIFNERITQVSGPCQMKTADLKP